MTFSSFHVPGHLYFVTAALCGWKRLFADRTYANIVLGSMDWLRQQSRMALYAFVLMPSHVHMILLPKDCTIGRLLNDFGSYTAHEILRQLRSDQRDELLNFFHQSRRDPRHQHSIWQDIQAKNLYSQDVLQQKMEYIHNNPTAKEWFLVEDRADYKYSSACYYDRGERPVIELDDVRDLIAG